MTICGWCERVALRQEIDPQTQEPVGACRHHVEHLKPIKAARDAQAAARRDQHANGRSL